MLILSCTAAGVHLCEKSKKRVVICKELISFCERLLIDLEYRATPAKELLSKALSGENVRHLGFISSDNLFEKKEVESILSDEENVEISQFIFSLGKTDLTTQKMLVNNFKEYINNSLNEYSAKHRKDSKLYLSFGVFFGIVFSLIWS